MHELLWGGRTPQPDTANLISFATWSLKVAFCFLSAVVLLFCHLFLSAANKLNALDAYVHAPDSNYHYELIQQAKHAGYTLYLLQMTSQKWRSLDKVNRTLWHWTIYKPSRVTSTMGMLCITGGSNVTVQVPPADKTLDMVGILLHC
ncbi:MAG: PhoPQ-activated protein PqaA family protein [Acidobacteriaceae bacterium]